MDQAFSAPPLHYLALEARAVAEAPMLRVARRFIHHTAASPHPVLLLPGLGATDRSTAQLRDVLRRQGHSAVGWGLGRHGLWTEESTLAVERRLLQLAEDEGEPVSVVGVSAGGILARELGRLHPEHVRQVVSVVSPFRHRMGDDNRVARVLTRLRPGMGTEHFKELPREEDRPPLAMPTTSIYSRSDGLIDWRSCLEVDGHGRDNIEVRASHLGAAASLAVATAVSERLSQRHGEWRAFRPPPGTRVLFPQFHSRRAPWRSLVG